MYVRSKVVFVCLFVSLGHSHYVDVPVPNVRTCKYIRVFVSVFILYSAKLFSWHIV